MNNRTILPVPLLASCIRSRRIVRVLRAFTVAGCLYALQACRRLTLQSVKPQRRESSFRFVRNRPH